MKFLPLILKNLLRKKIRTSLTILSIAVALFLFGLLVAINSAFTGGIEAAGADRLVIRNKISIIMPLPISYKERVLQINGVTADTYASWFGGVYQDPKNFFPQFAIDKITYLKMYPEYLLPKDQYEAFLADRQGCIIGRTTADRFGFKVGDRLPIRGTIFTGTWEFNIRGIFDGNRPEVDTTPMMFDYEYLSERVSFINGRVGWYIVKIGNPNDAEKVAKAIDQRFSNSNNETITEPEKMFVAGWVKQMGNIRLLILSIGTVVFFTLMLVTGNTMAIAVRERTGELAVLKTVGFTDEATLIIVLVESVAIAVIGGGIGIGLAKLFTLNGDPTHGFLPFFFISPVQMIVGLFVAALVGVVSGIIPAFLAMRLRIVDALRRV